MRKLEKIAVQILTEEKQLEYYRRFSNDNRMMDMIEPQNTEELEEDENAEERKQDVIYKIERNEWENCTAEEFKNSMSKSKRIEMLADYNISELSQMKLFKLQGYDIGFALKKRNGQYNEIVTGFNNDPVVRNIAQQLINAAIRHGGCYIDHFDGYLSKLYSSLGFVEYKRDKFDPQYDPQGQFQKKYGALDVIYRTHKSCIKNEKPGRRI